jgi:lipoate-protein ligase A
MLVDIDLSIMKEYLNPHKEKLKSKGIESVVSRCINLKEKHPSIQHSSLSQAII